MISKVLTRLVGGINSYNVLKFQSNEYGKAKCFLDSHPQPALSKEQKAEIDEYWAKFGVSFPDYTWHQMYYGVTGLSNPRFMPDVFVGKVLYTHYNRQNYLAAWDDKNIYAKMMEEVKFPNALCHCMNGCFYDEKWNAIPRCGNEFDSFCASIYERICNDGDVIIKESTNTNSGKGVKLLHIASPKELSSIIKEEASRDFIVQKKIVQHDFFKQFNSSSVNIIRIVSWRQNNEVVLFPASIRFGTPGFATDIAFINGKEIVNVIGIEETGKLKNRIVSFDGNTNIGVQYKNMEVPSPSWKRLRETIVAAHKRIPFFDVVGWDFTINTEGEPICIEYNIIWPGTILYQYANGPFAGEYTDDFLSYLNQGDIRIPRLFRSGAKGKRFIMKL